MPTHSSHYDSSAHAWKKEVPRAKFCFLFFIVSILGQSVCQTKLLQQQNKQIPNCFWFWSPNRHPSRHPLTPLVPLSPPRAREKRVVNTVTSDDLGSSSGVKRPMLPFSSPDPKAKSKMARQDGGGGGDDGARLSPTSVQSPPDLVRAVYATRKNAGQK